ncbi:MAG TPA: EF-P beta-lysylation protein EpmB, partial [Stenotrophomonas sp.]|nr:EF-P beta-lysylation protein EpmB [Stenotrophomonas sp.]
MITAALAPAPQEAPVPLPAERWQAHWRQAIRDPAELLAGLGLAAADLGVSAQALAQFPL